MAITSERPFHSPNEVALIQIYAGLQGLVWQTLLSLHRNDKQLVGFLCSVDYLCTKQNDVFELSAV